MSLAYHTSRFDIHPPFALCSDHPDIPGGFGVVLPGRAVHVGTPVLAATQSRDGAASTVDAPLVRLAKADDVGIVHRVVLTTGNDGYVFMAHGCYKLRTWSPVKLEHVRIGSRVGAAAGTADPVTIRITTVSLREPRVGDKFASRHGQKPAAAWIGGGLGRGCLVWFSRRASAPPGTIGGVLLGPEDLPFTLDGVVPDILFAPAPRWRPRGEAATRTGSRRGWPGGRAPARARAPSAGARPWGRCGSRSSGS